MSKEFKSNLTINNIPLLRSFIFPGGEVQIQLPKEFTDDEYRYLNIDEITIRTILNSSDSILELIFVKKALDNFYPNNIINLVIWYLPYARQDRVTVIGECDSGFQLLFMLQKLNFNKIFVADIHSDKIFNNQFWKKLPFHEYYISTINNTKLIEHDVLLILMDKKLEYDILIAPDKGSFNKVKRVSEFFNIPFVVGNKIRDPKNGKLSHYELDANIEILENKRLLVIDDICDGGGTFVLLSEELKNHKPMSYDLYVIHGIFSKGVDVLYNAGYGTIITTNSLINEERKTELEKYNNIEHNINVLNLSN